MPPFRAFAAIAFITWATPLAAAEANAEERCLTREQARAAVAGGQVVPLGSAMRAVEGRGQVVKARLCHGPKGLVYLLTLLARDGKVTRATVDAGTGRLAEGR
jgi:uncharacterized membrane protein YkoI